MEDYLTDQYSVFFRYEAGYDNHPAVLVFEMYKDYSGDWCSNHDDIVERYDFTDEEADAFANGVGFAEEWEIVSPTRELPPVILNWDLPQGALDMFATLKPYEYYSQELLGTDK
jgi:hypothetical protein